MRVCGGKVCVKRSGRLGRNAILIGLPFAILGYWTLYLAFIAAYAAVSFFYTQHVHHRLERLTAH